MSLIAAAQGRCSICHLFINEKDAALALQVTKFPSHLSCLRNWFRKRAQVANPPAQPYYLPPISVLLSGKIRELDDFLSVSEEKVVRVLRLLLARREKEHKLTRGKAEGYQICEWKSYKQPGSRPRVPSRPEKPADAFLSTWTLGGQ